MKLRFTPRASRDLIEIADFLRAENPAAARKVQSAIIDTLQVLAVFPALGVAQNVGNIRMYVARKYNYLIYYEADPSREAIVILTIQHPSRRRAYSV